MDQAANLRKMVKLESYKRNRQRRACAETSPSTENRSKVITIASGKGGVGKTALAVELVRRFPCDIISVDSALVYRGMDIGTAKPDAATLAEAPHRLIDIRDPSQPYSAAEFRNDALVEMAEITRRQRIPLLVGAIGELHLHQRQPPGAAGPVPRFPCAGPRLARCDRGSS